MALFVIRYISCMLIFFIGLKAPAIISHILEDSENLFQNNQQSVRESLFAHSTCAKFTFYSRRTDPRSATPGRN